MNMASPLTKAALLLSLLCIVHTDAASFKTKISALTNFLQRRSHDQQSTDIQTRLQKENEQEVKKAVNAISKLVKKLSLTNTYNILEDTRRPVLFDKLKRSKIFQKTLQDEFSRNSDPSKKVLDSEGAGNKELVEKILGAEFSRNSDQSKKVLDSEGSGNKELVEKILEAEFSRNSDQSKKVLDSEGSGNKELVEKILRAEFHRNSDQSKKVLDSEESGNKELVEKILEAEFSRISKDSALSKRSHESDSLAYEANTDQLVEKILNALKRLKLE